MTPLEAGGRVPLGPVAVIVGNLQVVDVMQHRFERSSGACGTPGEVEEAELLGDDVLDLALGDRQGQGTQTASASVPRGEVGEDLRTVRGIPPARGGMGTQGSGSAAEHHRVSGMADEVDERIEAVGVLRPLCATGVAPRTHRPARHEDCYYEVVDDNDETLPSGAPAHRQPPHRIRLRQVGGLVPAPRTSRSDRSGHVDSSRQFEGNLFARCDTPADRPPKSNAPLPALATILAEFLTELDLHQVTVVCNDPDPLRRPVQAAGSRRPLQDLDRSAAPGPQGPPRPRQVPPQRPQTPAVARLGRPAAHLRRPSPHHLGTRRQTHAPAHAERLADHFQNTQITWIDDSYTLIPIDQPELLADHLRAFLATHT